MSDDQKSSTINISSSTIEKGVDIAKQFVDKLITPSVEELGLLIKDQISFWRFKNQISILGKAKNICTRNNITIKAISPKILCPYLENASLEDDDDLQNKWAALLVNMVDSKKNIQNHVFPYILSQLSKKEFSAIESIYAQKQSRINQLEQNLIQHMSSTSEKLAELERYLSVLEHEVKQLQETQGSGYSPQKNVTYGKISTVKNQIYSIKAPEYNIKYQLSLPEEFVTTSLADFEVANIVRLGLIKFDYKTLAKPQRIHLPNTYHMEENPTLEVDIPVKTEETPILTQLGELFIQACQENISSCKNV